jgi:prophage regulatory protein
MATRPMQSSENRISTDSNHHRFLRLPDVIKRVGLGRASIYRLMEKGKFPKAHKLGERAVAWLESDVESWIQARVKASKEAA